MIRTGGSVLSLSESYILWLSHAPHLHQLSTHEIDQQNQTLLPVMSILPALAFCLSLLLELHQRWPRASHTINISWSFNS